ncbi:RRM_XMAS2 and SAC3_GANP domain-containing protein xmas [Megalopta genalis]|uniref:RRM_XMAS2 and SAC3_GANP domain-containing protein xmas n=1 Tax=Megalopta genalis TaxID=115081 RepID=UPI003FD6AB74
MERGENTQDNVMSAEGTSPKAFVFSAPNVLGPPNAINSEVNPEALDTSVIRKNIFTFAIPTSVSQPNLRGRATHQLRTPEKQYKPKISRHTFKPAVNVFAQALKDTAIFVQLKKNSRSQSAKINPENSITCTNVPQSLLTKVTAKEYFMMFGNLLRITIRPKKQIITVTYATKEEATIAYEQSGEYYGEKFNVEWSKLTALPKSPTKRKDLQKNIVTNFLNDDDLQMELDAMKNLAYNVHDRDNADYYNYISLKKKETRETKGALKTSARAKEKAAAKSEKHKVDSQISDLLPNASIEELQKIIRQPAHNSEDKYKVLEARDRLIRMKQTKSHTLAAAKAMVGICPDMCPEKERLMRESKRQLAFYEQLEGNEYKINHATAVKQYSRSSADQEEPMAHDLRPVKSLKMTMSYLLHEIANLCDQEGTNLGEWYHFLWDRTRGIRKDITQQELCCPDSVELVEQCARFHIVCSERLCAEEPSIFDKKINSDNLTKCLQTLKYMYHDLRVKGINCQNEPEFRAYIILLNLNNSNFMWDLQRLPKSVQRSPEVQFAQEVYSALESNNYYKFFKLVCKTTYLNACILLRYFNQVRLRALSVMVKAYCRTASTAYPLYELIDILGFEDETEAVYFCEQVGLNVAKDEYHVLLNRQNFSMPVLNIKQNRACNVIESKRVMKHLSIGECIAGGKMPEKSYKCHKPHNSFDTHGYLWSDSVNAEDQNKNDICTPKDPYEYIDEDTVEIKKSVLVSEKDENKPESTGYGAEYRNIFTTINATNFNANIIQPQKISENIFSIAKSQVPVTEAQEKQRSTNIFGILPKRDNTVSEANKTNESSIFGNTFNATTTITKSSNVFSKSLEPPPYSSSAVPFTTSTNQNVFSGTTQGNVFMKNVTSSSIFSNTFSNVQTAPKLSSAAITESNNKLKESPSFFTRPNQLEEIAKIENTKVADKVSVKRMQQVNVLAEKVLSELQTEVIKSSCSTIVDEEFDKMNICNKLRDDIENEILTEITHEICDNVLQEEIINSEKLHALSTKMKKRTVTKYFNIWKFNTLKRRQQREQRKSLDNTPVWLQKYSSEECAKLLYSKNQDLVIENMCRRREEPKIIKSYVDSLYRIEVIIFMGIQENLKSSGINMLSNHYWKLVISWPDLLNKPVLWHHKKIMNQYLCPDDYTANPIMKIYRASPLKTLHICIRNFEGLISDHNLVGSDALLFIANTSENANVIIKRLTRTILSRDRLMPIPLVVLVFGDDNFDTQDTEVVSTLEKLLDVGYLSIYTIMYEKNLNEETVLNITQTAIFWLSMNNSPKNPLEMDYLENICHVCLTDELWLRIQDDSSYNEKLLYALEEPRFIIDLYNEAVTHLMDIILDPESFMYTKFAPEFDKFVKNEHMMPCSYEYFDDSWKKEDYKARIEEVLDSFKLPQWKYSWPLDDNSTFHQNVISYYQKALFNADSNEVSCNLFSNLFFTSGMLTVSNFIDILLHIVKRKVNLIDRDLKVVYNKNHIKYFRTLPWWFKSNILNKYKVATRELNVQKNNVKNKRKSDLSEPITKKRRVCRDENNDSELDPLAEFCEYSRSRVMEVFGVSRKVEERLRAHQQQNNLFEERLKNALYSEIEST